MPTNAVKTRVQGMLSVRNIILYIRCIRKGGKMGDKITIKKIQLVSDGRFRIDLHNETKNKSLVMYCPKEELYKLLDEAEQEGKQWKD